jgi:molybdopterin-guanine dinucleotide biosynthesis protein B
MHVAAFTGWSRSGKTTLIAELIRHFSARGERVAAIKHTHHQLVETNGGDTAAFLAAGAVTALLAGDGEAVVFGSAPPRRVTYVEPTDLLVHCDAGIVLVEGFKQFGGWPRIEVDRDTPPRVEEVLSNLDRIWRS